MILKMKPNLNVLKKFRSVYHDRQPLLSTGWPIALAYRAGQ